MNSQLETPIVEAKDFSGSNDYLLSDMMKLEEFNDDYSSSVDEFEINPLGILSPENIKTEKDHIKIEDEMQDIIKPKHRGKIPIDKLPPPMREKIRKKNRLAARRCRQKQKDRIEYLEKYMDELIKSNIQVENEIKFLDSQAMEFKRILENHTCLMKNTTGGIPSMFKPV